MRRFLPLLFLLTLAAPAGAAQMPLHTERGAIVDDKGRQVLLRGVNVNQLGDYYQADAALPTTVPLTRADFAEMRRLGFNVVRLVTSWSAWQPERGAFDVAYLRRVRQAVRWAARNGIAVVLDMHQDAWGKAIATPPGAACPPGFGPAIGWDGAPAWATLTDGLSTCRAAGTRELSPAVAQAFQSFYADRDGIQTELLATWRRIAGAFAHQPAVIGYDLLNEPHPGLTVGVGQTAGLAAFYGRATAAVRDGERDGGRAHPGLVLFEPSVLWSGAGTDALPPKGFSDDPSLVFSPHLYAESITLDGGKGVSIEQGFSAGQSAADQYGVPMLSGEWGWFGEPADDERKVRRFAVQEDTRRLGSMWWVWRQACGDPHSIGQPALSGSLHPLSCPDGKRQGRVQTFSRVLARLPAGGAGPPHGTRSQSGLGASHPCRSGRRGGRLLPPAGVAATAGHRPAPPARDGHRATATAPRARRLDRHRVRPRRVFPARALSYANAPSKGASSAAPLTTWSASSSAAASKGPVVTATTRRPSARAQAMSRGVSPMMTVRSRGQSPARGRAMRRQLRRGPRHRSRSRPGPARSSGRSRRRAASAAPPARSSPSRATSGSAVAFERGQQIRDPRSDVPGQVRRAQLLVVRRVSSRDLLDARSIVALGTPIARRMSRAIEPSVRPAASTPARVGRSSVAVDLLERAEHRARVRLRRPLQQRAVDVPQQQERHCGMKDTSRRGAARTPRTASRWPGCPRLRPSRPRSACSGTARRSTPWRRRPARRTTASASVPVERPLASSVYGMDSASAASTSRSKTTGRQRRAADDRRPGAEGVVAVLLLGDRRARRSRA